MLAPGGDTREDDRVSVRSVLFVVHPTRLAAAALAKSAREWWERRDVEVTELGPVDGPGDVDAGSFDVAISFGGDGTMLRTVQIALPVGLPVLGVNLGLMG